MYIYIYIHNLKFNVKYLCTQMGVERREDINLSLREEERGGGGNKGGGC